MIYSKYSSKTQLVDWLVGVPMFQLLWIAAILICRVFMSQLAMIRQFLDSHSLVRTGGSPNRLRDPSTTTSARKHITKTFRTFARNMKKQNCDFDIL